VNRHILFVTALQADCALQYKVLMRITKYALATTELLLIFPAVLFMTSLFVRNIQPEQYEPAHTAAQIVEWYAARLHTGLWVLLIALPLTVLISGGITLLRKWSKDAELRRAALDALAIVQTHLATLLIAGATLTAGTVLAIVAVHVATD
jgi:hypothetical protein